MINGLKSEILEIDDTNVSNLEVVSDHLDQIVENLKGVSKELKEVSQFKTQRFTSEKEKKFPDKKLIPIAQDKYNEILQNTNLYKGKYKESEVMEKKLAKQLANLQEEKDTLKDLLGHLESRNGELMRQIEAYKKQMNDVDSMARLS